MEFDSRKRIGMELNMAPLIDVVFLLLIFFMLTSTMLLPEAIELQLPASNSAVPAEQTEITVYLNSEGQLFLNQQPIALAELGQRIKPLLQSSTEQPVSLKVDRSVSTQEMISVMDQLRNAGAAEISLATTQQ